MSTTHPISVTTEWDDLQIKYGNYLPVEREPKQEELSLQRQELLGRLDPLENKSLRQLENLEDAVSEDTLEVYRRKRLQELKERQAKAKFGNGEQVVICHLHKDSVPGSVRLAGILKEIARAHPDVKFCKGISDHLVPKFPDKDVPTLVIYKGGQCQRQILGLSLFGGESQTTTETVEWVLAKKCKLFETTLVENPLESDHRPRGEKGVVMRIKGTYDESSDSSDEEDAEEREIKQTRFAREYGDTSVQNVMDILKKI